MTKFPFVLNKILQRYVKTINSSNDNNNVIRILQYAWWERQISYITTLMINNNIRINPITPKMTNTKSRIVTTIQSNEFRTSTMMLPIVRIQIPTLNDRFFTTFQRYHTHATIRSVLDHQSYVGDGGKVQKRFLSYNTNKKDVDDLLTNVALIKYLQRLKKQRNNDLIQVRIVPLKVQDSYSGTKNKNDKDVDSEESKSKKNNDESKDDDSDDSDSDDDSDDDDNNDSDDDNNDTNNDNENDSTKNDNNTNNESNTIKNTTKVISLTEAVKEATSLKLDIIAVSLTATIPVVQYGNASSMKYHLQKKINAARKIIRQKNSTANKIKEIKIKNRCAEYDLQRKINNLVTYITKGHSVQITIRSRKWDTADIDNTVSNVLARIQNDAELTIPPKKNDVGNIVTLQVSPLSSSSSIKSATKGTAGGITKNNTTTESTTNDTVTESTSTSN